MLLLLVLSLVMASGMEIQHDCNESSEKCVPLIPEEAQWKRWQSGNLLPSNEFFQENCPSLIQSFQCYRDRTNACGPEPPMNEFNMNALVENIAEFCDEESDLRKGYVANVDCYNRLELREIDDYSCVTSVTDAIEMLSPEEMSQQLVERNLTKMCLYFYAFKPCFVQIAESTCGEAAAHFLAETASTTVRDILFCKNRDAEVADELVADLRSRWEAGDFNCDAEEQPRCVWRTIFPGEALRKHSQTGNFLPSNEFFQDSCSYAIRQIECFRDYKNACPDQDIEVNPEAYLSNAVEFCNEESDLRRDYLTHVDCANQLNFWNQSCFTKYHDERVQWIGHGYDTILREKEISGDCLALHIVKSCTLDLIKNSCGEEARQIFSGFFNRLEAMNSCRASDAEIMDQIIIELNSRISEDYSIVDL